MFHPVRNANAAKYLEKKTIIMVKHISDTPSVIQYINYVISLNFFNTYLFPTDSKHFGSGDQGRVNRSLGGVYVEAEEAGLIPRMDGKIIVEPIEEGLQLFVTFKKVPSLDYMRTNFEGFHSRSTIKKTAKVTSQILLFTSIESLESAKAKLENDEHVESADFVGMNSSKNQQVCALSVQCSSRDLYLYVIFF
jgi:hypothetical protein